ncbi:uncharacterized protein LOC112043558 [Bicyclus anynana]|uniref:Uncharacterized protein LOC112043558 n=1 Tax=Bicyclus anynana TaxID=110368 RepID=A0A6J1MK74_BICAN|nr:uncharacterized protein LOC112043558 [Bicyclus anynana]
MKGTLLIILAVWTLSAVTAIPRMRRAINPDEAEAVENKARVCAPQTPCAWEIYNSHTKISKIRNTYCECAEGTTCESKEKDESGNVYIYKCLTTPES